MTDLDPTEALDLEPTGDEDDAPAPRGNRPGDAEAAASLHGLTTYVVESLVDHPDQAEIDVEQRGNMVSLRVRLPEEELGKVIGRGGRIAKSIRTALMIAGSQHHLRVSLDIDSLGDIPDGDTDETSEPAS